MTHRRTYAMGIGGYGIYQYLALFHALERIRPRQVLLALYPANDLGSACSIATLPSWRALATNIGLAAPACDEPDTKESSLVQSSALVGAIDYAWVRLAPTGCSEPAIRFVQGPCMTIERGERHTRLTSMDNAENHRRLADAFVILEYANGRFARAGIRFSVLILPSRERVLLQWARKYADATDARLEALAVPEIELAARFSEFLNALGVPTKDATPDVVDAFEASVRDGSAFYPASSDGHPLAPGYAAYARAAVPLIESAPTE